MKAVILSALALSLAACHAPKPFLDTPLAIAPPKSIGDSGCASRACPATLDPVCVVYENNGHRMLQTFGNDCAVCIAPEFIVSRRRGACER